MSATFLEKETYFRQHRDDDDGANPNHPDSIVLGKAVFNAQNVGELVNLYFENDAVGVIANVPYEKSDAFYKKLKKSTNPETGENAMTHLAKQVMETGRAVGENSLVNNGEGYSHLMHHADILVDMANKGFSLNKKDANGDTANGILAEMPWWEKSTQKKQIEAGSFKTTLKAFVDDVHDVVTGDIIRQHRARKLVKQILTKGME